MNLKQTLKSMAINVATIALAVAIGIPLGTVIMKKLNPGASPPAPIALAGDTAKLVFKDTPTDLVLFASTTCNFCKAGIQLLDKSGANYKVYYIDQDAQAKKTYESMNTKGVPVLISKQHYIVGFSEDSWGQFLSKAGAKSAATANKGT